MKYTYDLSGNEISVTADNERLLKIIGQPIRQVVAPGKIATFSVLVEDAHKATFQWKFNGTDIPGATGDSLLLTNISVANEGQYTVVVTNSIGSVTSEPASLWIDSDGDSLPDNWEAANFGTITSQRGEGDPDADKVSNLDEFLDNTNPRSLISFRPRLISYSDAGGSVTVSPMKLSYELGEPVTLTATAFPPHVFVGWAGDLNTGDLPSPNPVTFTMNGHKTIRAKFIAAPPISPDLVACWRGETNADDLIGGHHGTFFSGATQIPPQLIRYGKVGGAFSFKGTTDIRIPDAAALKPAQITLEAWVFPDVERGGYQTIMARGFSTGDDDTWYLGLIGGTPIFYTFHTLSASTAISYQFAAQSVTLI
jgi:Divergent InlB B-repeat domain/Immunoglobulin I-set domain